MELGSELISSDIIAFFELIKNGFDAKTTSGVEIHFDIIIGQIAYRRLKRMLLSPDYDFEDIDENIRSAINKDSEKLFKKAIKLLNDAEDKTSLEEVLDEIWSFNKISVRDTGSGISLADLTDIFLVIGTPSRKTEVDKAEDNDEVETPFVGEKGIGRLSAMRLGNKLKVFTTRAEDTHISRLDIDWSNFNDVNAMLSDIDIEPFKGKTKPDGVISGTRIVISDLTSDWTKARVKKMADHEFSLLTDPLASRKKRKRIALFWNKERIAIPILDAGFLKQAHASIKGKYHVNEAGPHLTYNLFINDLGFDHPREIETVEYGPDDLSSIIIGKDSHVDEIALRDVGPFKFEAHWFNRRRLSKIDGIGDRKTVRDLHYQWNGIRLYRDGFRVYPYGSEDDDWLELDRKALMSRGYTLNKIQFIGQVEIGRMQNPSLIDQTNREGLRETPEQAVLLRSLQYAIQDDLRSAMARVEAKYKEKRIEITETKEDIRALERRAKSAIKTLKTTVTGEERELIDQLEHNINLVVDIAQRARDRINEVEEDSRQMLDMAGIGLLVEVVAHELARVSENALDNLNAIKSSGDISDDAKMRLTSLQASMKSISKRLKILDPLSVSGRQRAEKFSLTELLNETIEAHQSQFDRHNVNIRIDVPDQDIRVRVVKGMVVQVLENLISNSMYWMSLEKQKNPRFQPEIEILVETNPVTIHFSDNGPGIAPDLKDKVFELFYSLKDRSRRRGMGLYIARDCATFNGGALELDDEYVSEKGRLNRFVYQLTSTENG